MNSVGDTTNRKNGNKPPGRKTKAVGQETESITSTKAREKEKGRTKEKEKARDQKPGLVTIVASQGTLRSIVRRKRRPLRSAETAEDGATKQPTAPPPKERAKAKENQVKERSR